MPDNGECLSPLNKILVLLSRFPTFSPLALLSLLFFFLLNRHCCWCCSKPLKPNLISTSLNAKEEGYQPSLLGSVELVLFRECLSALAKKSLKLCRGRHQCVFWHGGDPAGWTRYESLLVGVRFKSISTGKIEDLRALLLRTPFLMFLTWHLWQQILPWP